MRRERERERDRGRERLVCLLCDAPEGTLLALEIVPSAQVVSQGDRHNTGSTVAMRDLHTFFLHWGYRDDFGAKCNLSQSPSCSPRELPHDIDKVNDTHELRARHP